VWLRTEVWTQQDEFAALAIERTDLWGAHLVNALGATRLPPLIGFSHPCRPTAVRPKPTTDSTALRQFFSKIGR
jgi:hypothetical protein